MTFDKTTSRFSLSCNSKGADIRSGITLIWPYFTLSNSINSNTCIMYCMFFRVFVKIPCLLPASHLFSILTLYKPGIVLTRTGRYYKATWRCEISVRELEKNIHINIHSKRNFVHVPPSEHVICSNYTVLYKHQFKRTFFAAEGVI